MKPASRPRPSRSTCARTRPPELLHTLIQPIGDRSWITDADIEATRRALSRVRHGPFLMLFDHIEGGETLSLRSGIPFTLYTGVDINSDTRVSNDRLFFVPRNSGLGPNFARFDARISKNFFFTKDSPARLEFTVEGGQCKVLLLRARDGGNAPEPIRQETDCTENYYRKD